MAKLAVAWMALMFSFAIACTDDADPITNAAFGAACTQVKDSGSTECASGVCTDAFDQLGKVCSVKCTTADPSVCPSGSEGMKCNGKGYCRP